MENKLIPGGRSLKSRIEWLLENSMMSDLKFIVGEENQEFPAHKFMFAVSSHEFYNGFYAMTPEDNIIRLPEIQVAAFKEFLNYIYTEEANISPDNILDIMRLADRYQINHLTIFCFENAAKFIDKKMHLLNDLLQFDKHDWMHTFFIKISKDPEIYLTEENIKYVTREHMKFILKTDETKASEKELFNLAVMWATSILSKNDPVAVRIFLGDLIQLIRFPTMTIAEFEECINEGILESKDVVDILLYIGKQFGDCKFPIKKRNLKLVTEEVVPKLIPKTVKRQYLIDRNRLNHAQTVPNGQTSLQFSVKNDCFLKGIGFYVNGKIVGNFEYKVMINSYGPRAFGIIKEFSGVYNCFDSSSLNKKRYSIEKSTLDFKDSVFLESIDIYSITFESKFLRDDEIFKKIVLRLPKLASNASDNIILDKQYPTGNVMSPISLIEYTK